MRQVLAFALAAYALYWVIGVIAPQTYRLTFLLLALALTFVANPSGGGRRAEAGDEPGDEPATPAAAPRGQPWPWRLWDLALVALAVASLGWAVA